MGSFSGMHWPASPGPELKHGLGWARLTIKTARNHRGFARPSGCIFGVAYQADDQCTLKCPFSMIDDV